MELDEAVRKSRNGYFCIMSFVIATSFFITKRKLFNKNDTDALNYQMTMTFLSIVCILGCCVAVFCSTRLKLSSTENQFEAFERKSNEFNAIYDVFFFVKLASTKESYL